MITNPKKLLITAVILFTSIFYLSAQNDVPTDYRNNLNGFYMSPKLGIFEVNNDVGFLFEYELGLIRQKSIFSLYGSVASEAFSSYQLSAFGITYGRYSSGKLLRFQYQAGLCYVSGKDVNQGLATDPNSKGIGVPIQFGIKILPVKFLGIGIDLNSNLNTIDSYFAPTISLYIGKLR